MWINPWFGISTFCVDFYVKCGWLGFSGLSWGQASQTYYVVSKYKRALHCCSLVPDDTGLVKTRSLRVRMRYQQKYGQSTVHEIL